MYGRRRFVSCFKAMRRKGRSTKVTQSSFHTDSPCRPSVPPIVLFIRCVCTVLGSGFFLFYPNRLSYARTARLLFARFICLLLVYGKGTPHRISRPLPPPRLIPPVCRRFKTLNKIWGVHKVAPSKNNYTCVRITSKLCLFENVGGGKSSLVHLAVIPLCPSGLSRLRYFSSLHSGGWVYSSKTSSMGVPPRSRKTIFGNSPAQICIPISLIAKADATTAWTFGLNLTLQPNPVPQPSSPFQPLVARTQIRNSMTFYWDQKKNPTEFKGFLLQISSNREWTTLAIHWDAIGTVANPLLSFRLRKKNQTSAIIQRLTWNSRFGPEAGPK